MGQDIFELDLEGTRSPLQLIRWRYQKNRLAFIS